MPARGFGGIDHELHCRIGVHIDSNETISPICACSSRTRTCSRIYCSAASDGAANVPLSAGEG